ncbi:MAG TPA: hypothetical protein ENK24_06840 [Anaerolineae bacterium]|nr:hypothetical protein [Anaerolineae bacterium]
MKASIEEVNTGYAEKVGIIKASLKEAKALGDFIPAEVVSGAQDMLKALEDEYRAEIAGLNRRAKAIEGEMAQRRRNAAANPAIANYRRFVERTDAAAKEMLAQSSRANNAGDFQKATGILEAILGDEWASDSIRARAEKALDAVRYNRRRHEEKKAAIAEQKRRRQQAAWFTAAEKAAYQGDFIVSLGRGQFAHLRPGKTAKGATFYKVVSALGYDAPAQYGNLPKRARRRDWRKGFTPRSIQKELAAAKKKLASVPSRFDADAVKAAWREAQAREAVMRLRVTVDGKAAGVTDDSFAAYGRAFAALLAGGYDIRVEESAAMGETLAEVTRDDDPNFPVIIVTARIRRKDAGEQRRLRAEKLARDAQAELA